MQSPNRSLISVLFRTRLVLVAVIIASLVVFSDAIAAIGNAQEAPAANEGIFTEAQAARGKSLYFDSCAVCHGGALQGEEDSPPLSGKHFFARWGAGPVSLLYGYINTQMPLGQPGSLGAGGAADVVAYILAVNKLPSGKRELPSDIRLLRDTKIGAAP